jgi:tetratricopeptide (TPR) repeat protein
MTGDIARNRRTLDRAVVMHGTSRYRLEAAALLARVVRESGARTATYGLVDTLATGRLAPVHALAGGPRFRWTTTLPKGFARRLDGNGIAGWRLVIRGADQERLVAVQPLLSVAAERLQAADRYDCPAIPVSATEGPEGRFIALLDALRFVSFTIARPAETIHLELELQRAISDLPVAARDAAAQVAEALRDLDRLTGALLAFGRALELDGRTAAAAATHVILYELALLRCDLDIGMSAAHAAGRCFRKLTIWREALRWYELGLDLAGHADDLLQAARLLDGLGNLYRERGAFPSARACYRDASHLALVAGDPVEIGNVAMGLMTVEREAGNLDAAAVIAWRALRAQTDTRQRMNLLLNLGTLLRDGGALDVAEDTYRVVEHEADDHEVLLMARDALAYCAALRGSRTEYEARRSSGRGLARTASPYIRAQIGYFRGAALRALGDGRSVRVLRAAERYARVHGLKEWEMRAGSLADQPMVAPETVVPAMETPAEVSSGIRSLLAAVSGS